MSRRPATFRATARTATRALPALAAAALCAATARPAAAQCTPPTTSNEARLLAFYAAPLAFSPASAPARLPTGAVRLAVEGAPVPNPGSDISDLDYCFVGAPENSRLAPAFGRPRLAVGLPFGVWAEGSYLPPVRIADAEPSLGSVALGFVRTVGGGDSARVARPWTVALRAHATFGHVRGPITCPEEALQQDDPARLCYGTEPSNDRYEPGIRGIEAMVGTTVRRRVQLYAGAGHSWLSPRFQVAFVDGTGARDDTRIVVDLERTVAFVGATGALGRGFDLSAQLYSVPADVTIGRVALGWRAR